MIKKKTVKVSQQEITSIICDKCKKEIFPEDDVEFQEVYFIHFIGGYGSIFGDESAFRAEFCQNCLKELIDNYIREVKPSYIQ